MQYFTCNENKLGEGIVNVLRWAGQMEFFSGDGLCLEHIFEWIQAIVLIHMNKNIIGKMISWFSEWNVGKFCVGCVVKLQSEYNKQKLTECLYSNTRYNGTTGKRL